MFPFTAILVGTLTLLPRDLQSAGRLLPAACFKLNNRLSANEHIMNLQII